MISMSKAVSAFLILLFSATNIQAASTKITITAPTVWLRNAPSLNSGNTIPVAKGQFYDVIGRTADNAWWQLNMPNSKGRGTWMLAELGATYSGKLDAVPVVASTTAPPKMPKKLPALPKWIPTITPQQKAIYKNATKFGKDANMFTVVGDCNSQPSVYLRRVATGEFDASVLDARLQNIVLRFEKSFPRVSLAASGGFGTASMSDPSWADPALCDKDMGPFQCEVWVSRASIVFIELGTGDQYAWKDFEKNYRPLIEHTLKRGALPVLVTKADDIEVAGGAKSGYINVVIRRLANEYQVPLLDFYLAAHELPNGGLLDEGDKDFHLNDAGIHRHILSTLQTVAAITQ